MRNYQEKREFLEYCIELGMRLEKKTNKQAKVLIGWITDNLGGDIPVELAVNYPNWFEEGWNQQVVLDNAGRLHQQKILT